MPLTAMTMPSAPVKSPSSMSRVTAASRAAPSLPAAGVEQLQPPTRRGRHELASLLGATHLRHHVVELT